jgi:hypothetical protein
MERVCWLLIAGGKPFNFALIRQLLSPLKKIPSLLRERGIEEEKR